MTNSPFEKAVHFYSQTYDYEKTVNLLTNNGYDATSAQAAVDQLKQHHKIKQRKTGIVLAGIGSFLLIFGFILSIILQQANMSIDIALFGPTTIGVVVLIWGMAKIF